MRLWRLCKAEYAAAPLDGRGALERGGRWNSPGRRAVYLSEHLSLAALEVLVHVDNDLVPSLVAVEVEVSDDVSFSTVAQASLPRDWREMTPPPSTKQLGDDWLTRGEESLLSVPSVIIPDERNYLLNPLHPDSKRIKQVSAAAFTFDPRLFRA